MGGLKKIKSTIYSRCYFTIVAHKKDQVWESECIVNSNFQNSKVLFVYLKRVLKIQPIR